MLRIASLFSEPMVMGLALVVWILLAAGCSSGPLGSAQGSSAAPGCHVAISAGGEDRDGSLTMGDLTIECLFDRVSASPTSRQTGQDTTTGDVSPAVNVPVGTGGAGR